MRGGRDDKEEDRESARNILVPIKEKRRRNSNPSPFVRGLLPKLLGLGRTIYTWEIYVVITNIQRNKE